VELLARRELPLVEDDVYGELAFGETRPRAAKAWPRCARTRHTGPPIGRPAEARLRDLGVARARPAMSSLAPAAIRGRRRHILVPLDARS